MNIISIAGIAIETIILTFSKTRPVKRSDFYYKLPNHLIAQYPTAERDGSRLMVVNRTRREIAHRTFRELPNFLRTGDCLVLNETRVFPARLKGYRPITQGAVEILLLCAKSWAVLEMCDVQSRGACDSPPSNAIHRALRLGIVQSGDWAICNKNQSASQDEFLKK